MYARAWITKLDNETSSEANTNEVRIEGPKKTRINVRYH